MSVQDVLVLIIGGLTLVGAGIASVKASRRRRREALLGGEPNIDVVVLRPSLAERPMGQTMLVELLPRSQGYLLGAKLYAPAVPTGFEVVEDSKTEIRGRTFVRMKVPASWLKSTDAAAEHGVIRYIPTGDDSKSAPSDWWKSVRPSKSKKNPPPQRDEQ